MKSEFLIGLIGLSLSSMSYAGEARTCGLAGHKGSECEVVRVLTRCDVEKMALRKKIRELESRVKELEGRPVHTIYRNVVVKEEVQKKVMKHNILSVYMARDISDTGSVQQNGSVASLQTAYEPGLKYQYEFGFGLVPEVGVDVKGGFLFGLGFEF